jgi:HK97 family phage portal protein
MSLWTDIMALVKRDRPSERGTGTAGRSADRYVDPDVAMTYATFWACVRLISEQIATLSWHVLRDLPNGDRERERGPIDWLLNVQANPEMTAFSWRETVVAHLLTVGKHYSEIQRDTMGRPIWLWPLDPARVTPERDAVTNALQYRVYGADGSSTVIAARDMFAPHGLGWDGITGKSVVQMAARSIGAGLTMDEYNASFYANGTHLGLVLEHPKALSEGARERLKKDISDRTGGRGAFKAIVAEEGLKLSKATMTMTDAQFLESRKFQRSEICTWFRVPPHKIGDLEKATFSNIEHQAIEFVVDTLLPWCRRLETEVDIKLFGMQRQGKVYTRLNIDTLLRGDMKSRYDAYGVGRQWGWLSVNDILRLEGRNGIGEQGDIYLQPVNMVEAGTEVPAAAPAAPAAIPAPEEEPKPTNVAALRLVVANLRRTA